MRIDCIILTGLLAASLAPAAELPALADLVHVAVVDRMLQIEWRDTLRPPDRPVAAQGPEARWQVRSPRPLRHVAPGTLELERPPAGTRDRAGYWYIWISSSPQRLVIAGHRGGRAAIETSLRFSQARNGNVHLVITDNVRRTFTQVDAVNIVELRAEHPRLVRAYLGPLLHQVTGTDPLIPGATDVYRVFSELSPDEQVEKQIHELLGELTHPSYARREAASAQLWAIGPAAVCAVLRMDRDALQAEQRVRLENLLVQHSRRGDVDPDEARTDVIFLADCLEFQDDRVRQLARRQLEQILERPIPMHPFPTPAEWSAAADIIRERALHERQLNPD